MEEREKNLTWKIKEMAHKITYRLFLQLEKNVYRTDEKFAAFSQRFMENFAIPLLKSHL